MKTFKQFLLGDEDDNHTFMDQLAFVAKEIAANCKHYFSLVHNDVDHPLFRGMEFNDWPDEFMAEARMDRRPSSTPSYIHRAVDDYFEDKFGIPFRSASVFAVGDLTTASDYGKVHIIFPKGKFDFLWCSDIGDMYVDFNHFKDDHGSSQDHLEERYISYLDGLRWQFNKDLPGGIKSENEVMINTADYYVVPEEFLMADSSRRMSYAEDFVPLLKAALKK